MACKLYNRDHVADKLHGTICMWKGQPVYVTTNGTDEDNVVITYLSNSKRETVKYTSDDFSYEAFPLGYYNHVANKEAVYLTRAPIRGRAQGLHSNNVIPYLGGGNFVSIKMHECILGQHPSFKDALTMMNDNYDLKSVAFHRHGCISRQWGRAYQIKYREVPIAGCTEFGSITKMESFGTKATDRIISLLGV